MSRGRVPPHQQRQVPWRNARQQVPGFVRSQHLLTQRVRQEARRLSGPQLRDLVTGPELMHPYTARVKAHEQFADDLNSVLESFLPRATENLMLMIRGHEARQARQGHIAKGLGVLRDADGNVIRLDAADRPYVLVNGQDIVYVKVYQARITPKGLNLDAQCTAANPDGTREVLLVEPEPTWQAPLNGPFY